MRKGDRRRPRVGRNGESNADRIRHLSKVVESGCWEWQLAIGKTGYGSITIKSQRYVAHRVSFEAFKGPIPEGMQIDHLCRNRACVNPDHLEAVTPQINVLRSTTAGALAHQNGHCKYGHRYAEHGQITPDRLTCLKCRSTYGALYFALGPAERRRRREAGLRIVDLEAYYAGGAA